MTQQTQRGGGANRDGGEPSWACSNNKHEGCRAVNCTCPHHDPDPVPALAPDPTNLHPNLETYLRTGTLVDLGNQIHIAMFVTGTEHFNSAHDAAGVIREEYEKFWDEVKRRRLNRRQEAMYHELLQIAAAALKYANQLASERQEVPDAQS